MAELEASKNVMHRHGWFSCRARKDQFITKANSNKEMLFVFNLHNSEPSHWICKPAYLVPVPSQDKLGGLRQEGHPVQKLGDDGGGSLVSPDGVTPSWIVGVSVSDISACTITSRRRFLLAPAHLGKSGKRAINGCLCECVLQSTTSLQCLQYTTAY